MKGRGFTSRARQGGWVAIAGLVVGVAGSIADQKSEDKQSKVKYSDSRDLSNLEFEQKNWLAQQQRAWELQDYQTAQNYKEDRIRNFAQYAQPNAAAANGEWGPPPERTDTTAQQQGLAQTDTNGQPYLIDPRTGKPVFGAGTMQQVA